MNRIFILLSLVFTMCIPLSAMAEINISPKKANFTKTLKIENVDITMSIDEITSILSNNGYSLGFKRETKSKNSYEFSKTVNAKDGTALEKRVAYIWTPRQNSRHLELFVKYQPVGVLKKWQDAPMGEEAQKITKGLCSIIQTEHNYDGTHQPCHAKKTSIKILDSFLGSDNSYYGFELDSSSSGFYKVSIKAHPSTSANNVTPTKRSIKTKVNSTASNLPVGVISKDKVGNFIQLKKYNDSINSVSRVPAMKQALPAVCEKFYLYYDKSIWNQKSLDFWFGKDKPSPADADKACK